MRGTALWIAVALGLATVLTCLWPGSPFKPVPKPAMRLDVELPAAG